MNAAPKPAPEPVPETVTETFCVRSLPFVGANPTSLIVLINTGVSGANGGFGDGANRTGVSETFWRQSKQGFRRRVGAIDKVFRRRAKRKPALFCRQCGFAIPIKLFRRDVWV